MFVQIKDWGFHIVSISLVTLCFVVASCWFTPAMAMNLQTDIYSIFGNELFQKTGRLATANLVPATITFSGKWESPEDIPLGPRKVEKILGESKGVLSQYVKAREGKEAVVVAGLHKTTHDPKLHITVRLNQNGKYQATYHVYTNKEYGYGGQKQTSP